MTTVDWDRAAEPVFTIDEPARIEFTNAALAAMNARLEHGHGSPQYLAASNALEEVRARVAKLIKVRK